MVNLIRWEELSGVMLCGHSYGDFGHRICGPPSGSLAALVYLDAFVPEGAEAMTSPALQGFKLEAAHAAGRAGRFRKPAGAQLEESAASG